MLRKGLAVAVILLFIGMSVVPSTAVQELKEKSFPISYDGDTLYVGGEGPNNYTRIQDAVDNSSDGDTVFVYSGFYNDYFPQYLCCVKIHKSIKLLGEDKYTTIIDGGSNRDVIRISADYVEISGFTIQNSTLDIHIRGSGIDQFYTDCEYSTIYDNIIRDNYYGISNYLDPKSEIYGNIISENIYGLLIWGKNTSIYGNIIENNNGGILTRDISITIHNNHFEGNEIGLDLFNSKLTGTENNFIDNEIHAYYEKELIFIDLILPFRYKNTWRNNYWDDWKLPIPRPIRGGWSYFSLPLMKTFGPFPSFQFDRRPAITPYNIEVL